MYSQPRDSHRSSSDSALYKLQQSYKYKEAKFGGTSEEEWNLALEEYEHICSQNSINPTQMAMYIHVMLKDEAKRFYYSSLKNVTAWQTIVDILNRRYSGQVRSRGIWEEVQSIDFASYKTDSKTHSEAFNELCLRIEKILPQCPAPYNIDMAMREALHRAVKKEPWSQNAIGNLATGGFTKDYKLFRDELDTALK